MDPATLTLLYTGAQSLNTLFSFAGGRRQSKNYLQQLHTDRLLTQLNTKANTNNVLDEIASITANNISAVSNANYDAFDSGSFKAIQERVETAGQKEIDNIELSNQIALSSIDTSLKNLKFNMRMNELKLLTDIGTTVFSTNQYMKDQRVLEQSRKQQLKELTNIRNETIKQTERMNRYYKAQRMKTQMRYQMGTLNFGVNERRTR